MKTAAPTPGREADPVPITGHEERIPNTEQTSGSSFWTMKWFNQYQHSFSGSAKKKSTSHLDYIEHISPPRGASVLKWPLSSLPLSSSALTIPEPTKPAPPRTNTTLSEFDMLRLTLSALHDGLLTRAGQLGRSNML